MHIAYDLHTFLHSFQVILVILFSSIFHYILQLIYQLTFWYIWNFHNLSILQHHMIYHIRNYSYKDSKQIFYHIFLYQLILYIHISIYLYSNVVLLLQTLVPNLHLQLQVSCYSTYLASLGLDIRLSTLMFMFLATSETHSFAYGWLILLQLPLHLFVLTL